LKVHWWGPSEKTSSNSTWGSRRSLLDGSSANKRRYRSSSSIKRRCSDLGQIEMERTEIRFILKMIIVVCQNRGQVRPPTHVIANALFMMMIFGKGEGLCGNGLASSPPDSSLTNNQLLARYAK
jgi:hypothetical protein